MKNRLVFALMLTLLFALAANVNAQQQSTDCPLHQKHQGDKPKAAGKSDDPQREGHSEMNKRGEQMMGFSQSKTTHHFLLKPDGGSIEVEANDPSDQASRDQIRQHLARIAEMFAEGNFDAPLFIHAQTPPGVPEMKQLKSEIKYEFERTERGGRVRLRTTNTEALSAIHEFLRFQIEEHHTGDPLEVS